MYMIFDPNALFSEPSPMGDSFQCEEEAATFAMCNPDLIYFWMDDVYPDKPKGPDDPDLEAELRDTLKGINRQLDAIDEEIAKNWVVPEKSPDEWTKYELQDGYGRFITGGLLIAKAQVLSALASIQKIKREQQWPTTRTYT